MHQHSRIIRCSLGLQCGSFRLHGGGRDLHLKPK